MLEAILVGVGCAMIGFVAGALGVWFIFSTALAGGVARGLHW